MTDSVNHSYSHIQNAITGQLVFRERPGLYAQILGVNGEYPWYAYYSEFFVREEFRQAQNDGTYGALNDS